MAEIRTMKPFVNLTKYPKNEAAFELGRFLFYSPLLSKMNNTSCATCHLQTTGFSHVDHQTSHGTNGTFSNRNAPSLVNLIWKKSYMWDGRITSLYELSRSPITSELEMDMTFEEIMSKLNLAYKVKEKFTAAYGDSLISEDRILKALTYYLIELNSSNSKYDKVVRKEAGWSFTPSEANGYLIFKQQCASCHAEPLFTSNRFEFNGLTYDPEFKDKGRMEITGKQKDYMRFAIPSLRNIATSFPYMHDGRFETLDAVLDHYQQLKLKSSKALQKIQLSDEAKHDLKDFLLTLTDTIYLTNQRLGYPPNDL